MLSMKYLCWNESVERTLVSVPSSHSLLYIISIPSSHSLLYNSGHNLSIHCTKSTLRGGRQVLVGTLKLC